MINHLHRAANNNLPLLLSISIFVHIWFPFDFFQLLNNWRSLYFHSLLILRPSLGRTGDFLVAEANPEFYDCTIQQGPPRDTPPKKKKVRKLCSLIKMSSPPPRPQIGSSQAATLTHSQTAYLERLRGRGADAPDADPCASLWAYSSLRSRYTGQPAPWRWCCQSYCRRVTQWKQNEAAGVPL